VVGTNQAATDGRPALAPIDAQVIEPDGDGAAEDAEDVVAEALGERPLGRVRGSGFRIQSS
jgi:hypothetical protein